MPTITQRQSRTAATANDDTERQQTALREDLARERAVGEDSQPNSRGRVADKPTSGLDVNILGRAFRVACDDAEKESLLKAVDYLDAKMQEIRDEGKVIGNERIAIMAALNIAHEYLSTRITPGFDIGEFRRRMKSMAANIDSAMTAQEDLFE